jgi:hypothetical protein
MASRRPPTGDGDDEAPRAGERRDPLWFWDDPDALRRRMVLAELLAPPLARRPPGYVSALGRRRGPAR